MLAQLGLGDDTNTLREALSVSPMDMNVSDDLIFGWDWLSSHGCVSSLSNVLWTSSLPQLATRRPLQALLQIERVASGDSTYTPFHPHRSCRPLDTIKFFSLPKFTFSLHQFKARV